MRRINGLVIIGIPIPYMKLYTRTGLCMLVAMFVDSAGAQTAATPADQPATAAAGSVSEIPEIMVTAQKRSEQLTDVPL